MQLSGYFPITGRDEDEKIENIMKGRYEFPELQWGNISGTAISLVSSLMQLDPKKRLTAEGALQHEFLAHPDKLRKTPTGNDLSKIHSKWKKVARALMTASKLGKVLHEKKIMTQKSNLVCDC